ncbi:MAG: uracil phosphoribosyltransferase [Bacteroidetes bacterium]|nr:MAG: uracil phosphoribosyltransferase [Bacteroidota bacterium]REK05057.1 MAG: uracil phosphoribosyltransferase [Bacteroidota bacterium]REK35553.1 MAG: uracil phosphoribosyltransferase [Bacteroidota bacterium]REK51656.1 MAG: uracil phosphoribosyltransferase [Bacteroidota bacterium]
MLINIGLKQSIVTQYIAEIRDESIQKDRMRFRRNLQRLGEIFAYEISKLLKYEEREVTTPLGSCMVPVLAEQPIIGTILRAGLPMHEGFLNYFDQCDNAFISAYRKHHKDGSFEIKLEYVSCPSLSGRVVILCDPMLATGASIVSTYKAMLEKGIPTHTHIVSILASVQGIEHVKSHLSADNVTIWAAAVDEELTAQSYIVPGLGDAGDLAYGKKL